MSVDNFLFCSFAFKLIFKGLGVFWFKGSYSDVSDGMSRVVKVFHHGLVFFCKCQTPETECEKAGRTGRIQGKRQLNKDSVHCAPQRVAGELYA